MTVFVVHPIPGLDLSKALEWGEIRYIADRYIYIDQIGDKGELPRENRTKMEAAASIFQCDLDYFLLVGDQLQLSAFSAELGASFEEFRVLRYDKKAEGYIPVLIQT